MFKWYQKAIVCYAYLSDANDLDSSFSKSKWFTRGWTLQELLAPARVQFFSASWTKVGEKSDLSPILANITGIDSLILRGEAPLERVSIAKRMSWAARRETTRTEDIAYCLMGIFDVSMPMLYGEGSNAFIRLQEEILRNSEDQFLFSWTASKESSKQAPYRGLFASSPAEFADSSEINSFPRLSAFQTPMTPTNRGIPLTSILTKFIDTPSRGSLVNFTRRLYMGLNCHRDGAENQILVIELVPRGGDQYLRASPERFLESRMSGPPVTVYVPKYAASNKIEPVPNAERQHAFYFPYLPPTIRVTHFYPPSASEAFLQKDNILLLGDWLPDKAALHLQVPAEWTQDGVLIMLWAVRVERTQSYKPLFDVALKPKERMHSFVTQVRKPSALFDERIISLGSGKPSLAFSVEPTVVRGFDMFSISVKVREPSTHFERRTVARWGGPSS